MLPESLAEANSFQLRALHLLSSQSLPATRRPLPPIHTRSEPNRSLLRNVAAQPPLLAEITTTVLEEAVTVAVETAALATKAAEVSSVMLDVVASLLVGVVEEAISPPRAVASLRQYEWVSLHQSIP